MHSADSIPHTSTHAQTCGKCSSSMMVVVTMSKYETDVPNCANTSRTTVTSRPYVPYAAVATSCQLPMPWPSPTTLRRERALATLLCPSDAADRRMSIEARTRIDSADSKTPSSAAATSSVVLDVGPAVSREVERRAASSRSPSRSTAVRSAARSPVWRNWLISVTRCCGDSCAHRTVYRIATCERNAMQQSPRRDSTRPTCAAAHGSVSRPLPIIVFIRFAKACFWLGSWSGRRMLFFSIGRAEKRGRRAG